MMTNPRRGKYRNLDLTLVAIFFITYALFLVVSCGSDNSTVNMPQSVVREMAAWGINPTGVYDKSEVMLPSDFTDANWGLKQIVCQEAGYDLRPVAGQSVVLAGYLTNESRDNRPMVIWAVLYQEECVCLFKTHRIGEGAVPGVYSVRSICKQ